MFGNCFGTRVVLYLLSIDVMQTLVYVSLTTCSWMQVTGTWPQHNTSATGQTTIFKMLIAGSTRHIGSETLVWTIYFESLKPSLHFIKCVCVCNVHANVILSCTQLRLALIRLLLCTISLQLGSVGLSSEQLVSLQFTSPATCSKAKHCIQLTLPPYL